MHHYVLLDAYSVMGSGCIHNSTRCTHILESRWAARGTADYTPVHKPENQGRAGLKVSLPGGLALSSPGRPAATARPLRGLTGPAPPGDHLSAPAGQVRREQHLWNPYPACACGFPVQVAESRWRPFKPLPGAGLRAHDTVARRLRHHTKTLPGAGLRVNGTLLYPADHGNGKQC